MPASAPPRCDRIVPSPREPLVAGRLVDALERQRQGDGHRRIVARAGPRVSAADRVAAAVRDVANITSHFSVYDSVEAARLATWPWRTARLAASGALLRGGPPWSVSRA